ncbi:MAG: HEPN domain-containing protein [Magnetococcales bacterium]|nr:HEPN domain-containing protein [Magnetococcales bacterium]MBF0173922.1 HEPN domain-containing protein [Magnetococcales bacterium]MBF0629701.1 HEPN domain-containing protein [Magnetococcales bacterium]
MAGKDCRALTAMDNVVDFPDEIFGFHVQQAVEKGLKGWLCCLGVPYPRRHDLDELAKLIQRAGEEMPDIFLPLLDYTDFAIAFRYDAYPELGQEINRKETRFLVTGFLDFVDKVFQRAEKSRC